MRKLIKRVAAVACATALTVAMSTSCFAADRWVSYFGLNSGWSEAAYGELTQQSDTSWTAKMDLIGWGGVWGAQVKDEALSIKAGTEYKLSFKISSDTVDKWMFVKVADGEDTLLWGDWVQVKTGSATTYEKTFKVSSDATKIVFGIGGEFGDRTDQEEMYALTSTLPNDGDANYATTLTLTDFSLTEASAASGSEGGSSEASKDSNSSKDDDDKDGDNKTNTANKNETTNNSGAVQTGDSTPIACAAIAIIAAAGIVVFTRKREDA